MSGFELKQLRSQAELVANFATDWLRFVTRPRSSRVCCVALSGGRIAATLFDQFSTLVKAEGAALEHLHFFWADERCVAPEDPESNFNVAQEHLFRPLHVAPENIHRVRGELPPAAAMFEADAAIRQITSTAEPEVPVLDLVLLGMGEDGHVASLFPNAAPDALRCDSPYVFVTNAPKPPPTRISLSYRSIIGAREVWVLVSGSGKLKALAESLAADGSTPLAAVLQGRKNTIVYTDIPVTSVGGPVA